MSEPDISVIIVNYNTGEETIRALKSLRKFYTELNKQIIVVDNASKDGSSEAITREFPEVLLLQNAKNRGFAAANNQGFKRALAPYILMLNPDAFLVDDASLSSMLKLIKSRPNIAAVSPKLVYPDGRWQHSLRRFPTPLRMFFFLAMIDRFLKGAPRIADYMLPEAAHKISGEAEQPMGACLLLSRAALDDIGEFDERFFVYFEEVDWLKRAKDKGYSVYFMAEATVAHSASAASDKVWSKGQEYFNESLIKYFAKHYGKAGELWIKTTLVVVSPIRIATLLFHIYKGKLPANETLRFVAGYYLFLGRILLGGSSSNPE